ncbi:hypothetical protein MMC06_000681 [Schaereria dolodes]|nr:hypothetical protein [Schaereria dolodes]
MISMDDSARQLQHELHGSVVKALSSQRPILTHLNADTTWLLQLPYPRNVISPTGRSRYNVLIDPWLQGPQSDVASWFSRQWHSIDSSVQTISELNNRLKEIEDMSQRSNARPNIRQQYPEIPLKPLCIDAVVLSHEFTDHTHKQTLLEIDPATPVFATQKAADLVEGWHHFDRVQVTAPFSASDTDWRHTSKEPLPQWLGISRIVTKRDALYYHSAIMITFNVAVDETVSPVEENTAEAIIYSPHGIVADDLRHLPKARPPITTLALLHGLHDIGISLTAQLNLGAYNGLKAQRMCGAKYWVGTHDEVKKGRGLVAPLLRRRVLTIKEAIDKEKQEKGHIPYSSELAQMKGVLFAELTSGESLLLE